MRFACPVLLRVAVVLGAGLALTLCSLAAADGLESPGPALTGEKAITAARGNLAPHDLPDTVQARSINGRFTWVLTWNRVIAMEIYSQPLGNPFLGNQVEIADDDGVADPTGELRLEVRGASLGTLRLLNLGNRSAPSVPALSFEFNDGRLGLI